MTSDDRFELIVTEWLSHEAAYHLPDHLGEVAQRTAVMRQRPWWSSPERWLPMDLTAHASALAPLRLGRLILIALLILVLAAATIAIVGSRAHRVPPPFGPAANGLQIASGDGDIYALDGTTHQRRPIVTGPTWDFGTTWSRDGTSFLFLRAATKPGSEAAPDLTMAIATADGSKVREIVGPVKGLDWFDWSADGSRIVFLTRDSAGKGVVNVVDVATRHVTTLDIGFAAHLPTWLPPDGGEIVFRGEGSSPAIYAVRPDGSGLHRVSVRPAVNEFDYSGLALSSDGQAVAFTRWTEPDGMRLYVLDIATGAERRLPTPDGTIQGQGVFAPDGLTVAYPRTRDAGTYEIVVAPVDGSSQGRVVGGPTPRTADGGMDVTLSFAPDGTALLARYGTDDQATYTWLPIDGSPGTELDQGSFEFVDVQRVAP